MIIPFFECAPFVQQVTIDGIVGEKDLDLAVDDIQIWHGSCDERDFYEFELRFPFEQWDEALSDPDSENFQLKQIQARNTVKKLLILTNSQRQERKIQQ